MTSLIQAGKTKRGRPAIIDNQHFSYVSNGPGSQKVYNWRCSNRKCDATLGTRKSSGNLVGDTLPSHQHGNQLMKKTAKKTESAVLFKYAGVQGATPSTVLQEISYNMLSSNFPGQLSSSSTAGAIRMKLWRQRQVRDKLSVQDLSSLLHLRSTWTLTFLTSLPRQLMGVNF